MHPYEQIKQEGISSYFLKMIYLKFRKRNFEIKEKKNNFPFLGTH